MHCTRSNGIHNCLRASADLDVRMWPKSVKNVWTKGRNSFTLHKQWFFLVQANLLIPSQEGDGCIWSYIHTRGSTPLHEGSACHKCLHLHNTQHEKNSHTSDEIRTRNPSSTATANLRLRPRGHRDRPNDSYSTKCNETNITTHQYTWILNTEFHEVHKDLRK